MKRRLILCMVFVSLALFAVSLPAQDADEKVDDRFPPRVVKTEPADRSADVEATLREIKVTYDRPMMDGTWSWIIESNLGVYPGDRELGAPRWENGGRTCVLPVRLRPDTLYAVGCNSYRHTGFRDRKARIAVPHVWVFRTRPGDE